MRLYQIKRSFTVAAIVLCAAMIVAGGPALGFTIESPTEGQTVRGQVRVVIPRSSLPSDVVSSGFLAVKINGQFCSAVSAVEREGSDDAPVGPSIVYVWDSKAPTGSTMRGEAKTFNDGKYEILVEAHSMQAGAKDAITSSAKVNVVLKNQVDQPNPAPPIDLRYRYLLGQTSRYRFNVAGEVFDQYGFSLSGGQPPIMGEFEVTQSVEDSRRDGTALMRYKVDKDSNPFAQVPGPQVMMLAQMQRFRSIYKIMDTAARVLEANVFSTKTVGDVTDCLVTIPGGPAKMGATWPATFHVKLEGLSDPADLTGQSKLEALEWESGVECAKIVSTMNGSMRFNFLQPGAASVKCTSTAYFAYKLHKLIKNVLTIEFSTNLDDATVSKLQTPIPVKTDTAGGAAPVALPMGGPSMMGGPLGPGYYSPTAASTGATGGSTGTKPVKVRLVVTQELVKK